MSGEKYYPNFTDEELEIGWLSDLAEVTLYVLSGGTIPWDRSQKSMLSPCRMRECPLFNGRRDGHIGKRQDRVGVSSLSLSLSDFKFSLARVVRAASHGLFSFSLLCQLNLPAQDLWLARSRQPFFFFF